MPGIVFEKQVNNPVWKALKAHILRERQRKKQEQEANAEEERLRKEREKKHKENAMTLEETKEQITNLESRLAQLKEEKHQLFLQLKKVLNEDENRKRQLLIKESSEMAMAGYQQDPWSCTPHPPVVLQTYPGVSPKPPVSFKIPLSNTHQAGFPTVQPSSDPLHFFAFFLCQTLIRHQDPSPSPPASAYQSPFQFKANQGLVAFTPSTQKSGSSMYYGVPSTPSSIVGSGMSQPAYSYNNPGPYVIESKPLLGTFLAPRTYMTGSLHPQLEPASHKASYVAADYAGNLQTRHALPVGTVVTLQPRSDPKSGSITHGFPMRPVPTNTIGVVNQEWKDWVSGGLHLPAQHSSPVPAFLLCGLKQH